VEFNVLRITELSGGEEKFILFLAVGERGMGKALLQIGLWCWV